MAKKRKYLPLVLLLVLVLGLAATGAAVAADNAPAASPVAGLGNIFLEKLAANLGIEVSQLQEAMKKSGQQAVEEGVASGLIDSNKAQRMQEALDKGFMPRMAGKRQPLWHQKDGHAVAEALGMTPQELRQELQSGKTLEQLASDRGISLDQLKEKVIAATRARLDQAVTSGKLSQDKADQILERLQQVDLSQFPRPPIR